MNRKIGVRTIGVALLLFISFLAVAQPYHRLTPRDFAGNPADDGFAAYTNCYVSYSYNTSRRNGVYNVNFNVQVFLNSNRSWIRFSDVKTQEDMQSILTHEQGHYNMAYLMKNELYSVFNHHRYTSNYQAEIAALFRQVDAKYHQLNTDYETQTQHMANYRNQQKWNLWFSKQLNNNEELASN
jgi:hypothetical protein